MNNFSWSEWSENTALEVYQTAPIDSLNRGHDSAEDTLANRGHHSAEDTLVCTWHIGCSMINDHVCVIIHDHT